MKFKILTAVAAALLLAELLLANRYLAIRRETPK